ncbi:MAG: hypothetical protein RLZZ74_3407 [Cyanobacteriota bacterium]|jgi:hypothetical protein
MSDPSSYEKIYDTFYKDISANFAKRKYVEKNRTDIFEKVVFEHLANIYALISTITAETKE